MLLITTHFLAAYRTLPLAQALPYALWLGASLWTIGGLLERRPHYLPLEALRLAATAGGVLLGEAWFGALALPAGMQGAIVALAAASLAALWLAFKPWNALHGYLPDR